MNRVRIEDQAAIQIQDIYRYTAARWDISQAVDYIHGLTATFDAIASSTVTLRQIPPAFGIDGYVHRFRHHFIYWKRLADGDIGIFAVLHERQHQIVRLSDRT